MAALRGRQVLWTAAALLGLTVLAGLEPLSLPARLGVLPPLSGAEAAAKPLDFSLRGWLSGDLQARLSAWLDRNLAIRRLLVRVNNGIYYGALRQPQTPSIVIGRDGTLYERGYIDVWCRRDVPADLEAAVAGAARAHRALRARGKALIVVVSPGKASIDADRLPPGICTPKAAPLPHEVLVAALRQAGVPVIDGHRLAADLKAERSLPVFARDGAHWNDFGLMPTLVAVMAEAERQLGRPLVRPRAAGLRIDNIGDSPDRDLERLLNLPLPLRPYPSVHLDIVAEGEGPPLKAVAVGTSFSWSLLDALTRIGAAAPTPFYYYFNRRTEVADGRVSDRPAADLAAAFRADVGDAEAVIVEVNEAGIQENLLRRAPAEIVAAVGGGPRPD